MTPRDSDAHALASLLALSEWNVAVGREVVGALRRMGGAAVPALVDLARDRRQGAVTRLVAVWLLGRIGGGCALDVLRELAADREAEVAAAARRALARLGAAPGEPRAAA